MTVTLDEVLYNLELLERDLATRASEQPMDVATYGDVMMLESRVTTFVATNQLPTGGKLIGAFNIDCPTGWTRVSAFDDKFIVGKATYGGTGGATTHTHSMNGVVAHTHSVGTLAIGSSGSHSHPYTYLNTAAFNSGAGGTVNQGSSTGTISGSWPSHEHSDVMNGTTANASAGSGTSGTGSNLPAYTTTIWCSKD